MGAIRDADAAIDEEADAVKNLAAGAAPKTCAAPLTTGRRNGCHHDAKDPSAQL